MKLTTNTTQVWGLIKTLTEQHPILLKHNDKLKDYINEYLGVGQ